MIVLSEMFLGITMSYDGKDGYKGYNMYSGSSHTIEIYNISNKHNVFKDSYSSYDQTVVPVSIIHGRDPDMVTIEGRLCYADEFATYLSGITSHNVNTLMNVFLPCSLVDTRSTCHPDINNCFWLVDSFKIKRNIQKRNIIAFELILCRWYDGMGG